LYLGVSKINQKFWASVKLDPLFLGFLGSTFVVTGTITVKASPHCTNETEYQVDKWEINNIEDHCHQLYLDDSKEEKHEITKIVPTFKYQSDVRSV